eukprot:5118891-Pyramimonas_sp.AAC.1
MGVWLTSLHAMGVWSVRSWHRALVGARRPPGFRMRFSFLSFRGIPAREQSFERDAANVRGSLVMGKPEREMRNGILIDI